MALSWEDLLSVPEYRSRKRTAMMNPLTQLSRTVTDAEKESLISSTLGAVTGGIGFAADVLDTPGSVVRGLLAGQPGRAFGGVFDPEQRVGGRELLANYGLTTQNDPNAWEWSDFGGGLAEVALDPLLPLSFGAGAVTKGGAALRAAGLLDNAAAVASKKFGREFGKREARQVLSVGDVLAEAGPKGMEAFEIAAKAKKLDPKTLMAEPIGGLVSSPWGAIGTGAKSQRVAQALDATGGYIMGTAPVRIARSLFDTSVMNTVSAPFQKLFPTIKRQKEDIAAGSNDVVRSVIDNLDPLDRDKTETLQAIGEHWDEWSKTADPAQFFANHKLTPLNDPDKATVVIQKIQGDEAAIQQKLNELGVGPTVLQTEYAPKGYLPRQTPLPTTPVKGYEDQFNATKQLSLTNPFMQQREKHFDWFSGTAGINRLSKDAAISGPESLLKNRAERIAYILKETPEWEAPSVALMRGMPGYDAAVKAQIDELQQLAKKRSMQEWKPQSEQAAALAAKAAEVGVHPLALREVLNKHLQLENSGVDKLFSDYKAAVGGRGAAFWKRLYAAEDVNQLPNWDAFADGIIKDDIGQLLGIAGASDPSQALFHKLKEYGSPDYARYEGVMKLQMASDPAVIDSVLHSKRADLEQLSSQIASPLSEEELAKLAVYDRAGQLSDVLQRLDPQYAQAKVGLFDSHVAANHRDYMRTMQTSKVIAEGVHGLLADAAMKGGPQGVPIEDALNIIGFTDKAQASNYLLKTLQDKGFKGQSIAGLTIPKNIIEDAKKVLVKPQEPESISALMSAWDTSTNLFKLGSTAVPAFHMRNLLSGLAQNTFSGFYSLNPFEVAFDHKLGNNFARGKDTAGLAKSLPLFEAQKLNDAQANEQLRELISQFDLWENRLDETVGPGLARPVKGSVVRAGDRNNFGRVMDFDPVTGKSKVSFVSESGQSAIVEMPEALLTVKKAPNPNGPFNGMTPLERLKNELAPNKPVNPLNSIRKGAAETFGGLLSTIKQRRVDDRINFFKIKGAGGATADAFAPAIAQREVGQYVEAQIRIPAFVSLLRKGVSPAEAARRVKSAHVDYSNLTDFEKSAMRRLFPFYTFTRGISENVATQLLETPGGAMAQAIKLQDRQRKDGAYVPGYIGEGMALQVGDGKFISGLGLAHEAPGELVSINRDSALDTVKRTGQKILAMANPALKLGYELTSGTDLFTGKPLREVYPYPFNNSDIGILANRALGALPTARYMGIYRKLGDDRKEPWQLALDLGLGTKITDISGGIERAREFDLRKALEDRIQRIPAAKSFTNIYVPKDQLAQLSREDQLALLLKNEQAAKARKIAADKRKQQVASL